MIQEVNLYEDTYTIKNLSSDEELTLAARLRHEIFAEMLKWVPLQDNSLEFDEYDRYAIHFGVLKNRRELTSYVRLIRPDNSFMIEKIDAFRKLLPTNFTLIKESAAEISRFCISRHNRNVPIKSRENSFFQLLCLSKGVYHWCVLNSIRFLYAITEYKIYRLFKKYGFPFKSIGSDYHLMPDGARIVLMVLDWREFEKVMPAEMERFMNSSQNIIYPHQIIYHRLRNQLRQNCDIPIICK